MRVTFRSSRDWYHFRPAATTKPGRWRIGKNLAAYRVVAVAQALLIVAAGSVVPIGHASMRQSSSASREAARASLKMFRKYVKFFLTRSANQKYTWFTQPAEGRSRSSRYVGPGCDGRCGVRRVLPPDEIAAAYGEVVWSWRRDRGVYPPCLCGVGNGDNQRRSPGRARSKPSNHCAGKAGVTG